MLKKRVIGVILIHQGIVVQSIGFSRYFPIGKAEIAVEYLNRWGIDEIILLDIDASRKGESIDSELVKRVSKYCMVPLTVGGGIHNIETIRELIHAGADKVSINTHAWKYPEFLAEASAVFGKQCIVLSCDIKRESEHFLLWNTNTLLSAEEMVEKISKIVSYGAGEILVQSCDRDGMQNGYDLEILSLLAQNVSVPLIALGGVGHPGHFAAALKIESISAVAAANFFHFFEHSVSITKEYVATVGPMLIRRDSEYSYTSAFFNQRTRYNP